MSKALYLIGAAGLGAAAAIYLFDEKQGKKRRTRLKKQWNHAIDVAGDTFDEYSREIRDRVPEYSRRLGSQAQKVGSRAQEYWKSAGSRAGEYAQEFGKNAGEYARSLGHDAGEYAKRAGERSMEYVKEGQVRWSPSARFVGAVGSALAFYGAGRPGMFGMLLRTLSLGMFLRALLASR
jgi:gas vesicle protein